MGFGLGKLIAAVTSPGNLLLLAMLLGLAGLWLGHAWGRALLTLTIIVFTMVAVTPISIWALLPLEERFPIPQAADLPPIDGIIVLGGALMPVGSAEHDSPQLNREAERLTILPGLLRRHTTAKVIFTGGSGDPRRPDDREAPFAARLLTEWGLDMNRILFEGASRNTWENAVNSEPLMGGRGTWLLVTSAAHMPRAMGVFRTVMPETHFVAWPVGFNANRSEYWRFGLNLSDNLDRLENAAHEWRGLLAYRMGGRIPSLLPAP